MTNKLQITLRFSRDETAYVFAVLAERPYREVADLIARVQTAVREAEAAAAESPRLPLGD